uniref:mitochondrial transcription rescue factor 1-like isoform X1 n=1 Tax=Styela clava TaxID=7725 RepID=UPI001939A264|nr:mitochondrial transcription rescue factor 1-like isoform X1 [Styela clava]
MLFRNSLVRRLIRHRINIQIFYVQNKLLYAELSPLRHAQLPFLSCLRWMLKTVTGSMNQEMTLPCMFSKRAYNNGIDQNDRLPKSCESEMAQKQGHQTPKPPGYKDIYITVTSARAVTIANKAFSLGTKKLNELFFDGCIRLNGKRLQKKSVQASTGDVIDVILETSDTEVILQRVEILVEDDATAKGNERFYMRRWKRLKLPLLDNNKEP